jgi:hypothetical protein
MIVHNLSRALTRLYTELSMKVIPQKGRQYPTGPLPKPLHDWIDVPNQFNHVPRYMVVMSSGRRESVMLLCISPVSKLYLEPIDHYEPDLIHVFIGNGDDSISSLARGIYESSKKDIPCDRIVEHQVDDSDYNEVLGGIIDVIGDLHEAYGKDLDVFINISSGTPEFSAAGMFASMLPLSAIAFRVDAECDMAAEDLSRIIVSLNESVKVSEPERVTGLKNDRPDDEMIVFLRIVDDLLNGSRYPKYRTIIDRLKDADAWSYDPERKSGYGRTSLEEKEERYLKRHYIAIALENGWLERPSDRTMRLTDSGKAYISVFRPETERRPMLGRLAKPARRKEEACLMKSNSIEPRDSICEEIALPSEPITATFVSRDRRYTFNISMDQHDQHSGHM